MPERPGASEREFRESGRVVAPSDAERYPVGRIDLDPRDRLGQETDGGRWGPRKFAVADLNEERRKPHIRTVMGRLIGPRDAEGSRPFAQQTQGGGHPARVGGDQPSGTPADLGGRTRIAERMDRQARYILTASMDRWEDQGRAGGAYFGREPEVDFFVMNVDSRSTRHPDPVGKATDRRSVKVLPRRG